MGDKILYRVVLHPTTDMPMVSNVLIVKEGEKNIQVNRSLDGKIVLSKEQDKHLIHWSPKEAVERYLHVCLEKVESACRVLDRTENDLKQAKSLAKEHGL